MKKKLLTVLIVTTLSISTCIPALAAYAKDENVNSTDIVEAADEKNEDEEIILRINLGKASLNDYELLGISGVVPFNEEIVQKEIETEKNKKGCNLTKEEIQNVVNEVNTRISLAVSKINKGNASIEDFNLIKCNSVNSNNISEVYEVILEKEKAKGTELTIDEINDAVNIAVEKSVVLSNIKDGTGQLTDYENLGVEGITNDNIKAINEFLKGKDINTVNKLKSEVNKILKSLNNIDAGQASLEDYNLLSLTSVTQSNLPYVNGELKGQKLFETSEIMQVVNKVNNILDIYNRINTGKASLDDYTFMGASNVTKDNIDYVNVEMRDSSDVNPVIGSIDDAKEILQVISQNIKTCKITKIINEGKETILSSGNVKQYQQLGEKGIKKDILPTMQKAIFIEQKIKGSVLSSQEIKNVIESTKSTVNADFIYEKIIKEYNALKESKGADPDQNESKKLVTDIFNNVNGILYRISSGNASAEDYKYVEIDGVTSENIIWVNAEVKEGIDINLSTDATEGKLQNIQAAIYNLQEIYGPVKIINDGRETLCGSETKNVYEYMLIGKAGIDEKWLPIIRSAVIIGKESLGRELTKTEIYNLIDYTQSDIDNYVKLPKILDALNAARGSEGYDPNKVIKEAKEHINEAFLRIVHGEGTYDDFVYLNLNKVTVDNIAWLNAEINERIDADLSDEDVKGKIYKLQDQIRYLFGVYNYVKIVNDGKETLDRDGSKNVYQYMIIGRPGINEAWLPYIRQAVVIKKESLGRELTRTECNEVIDAVLKDLDSAYKLPKVVEAIKAAKEQEGYDANAVINNTLNSINEAFLRAVKGKASLADFDLLNVKGITSDNIAWINAEIAEGIDVKLSDEDVNGKINNLQTSIYSLLDLYNSVKAINDGKETVAETKNVIEYSAIGRDGINESKLSTIREAVAKAKAEKGRELTKTEILAVIDETI